MDNVGFDQLITLCRAIEFKENSREGLLTITDDTQRQLLDSLIADGGEEFGLSIRSGDPHTLSIGDRIELEVGDPRIRLGIIATDLGNLLIAPKAQLREPKRYFLIDSKFSNSDETVPDAIVRYRQVLALICLLKEAAAFLDEEAGDFIFVDDGKFQLPIRYTRNDLQQIDIIVIERLLESFGNDTHREQKLAILAKSVRTVCGSAIPNERFSTLLRHLPDLQKSFSEGYRLFVADFSYDKIANQLETAKLEEITKIHKTFSDIQNQILGIPVATVVVATQMQQATAIGYEFWVNTAVLIGCWVFAILSALMLRNQLHTLSAIGDEIERKKTQMLTEYQSIADLITRSFPFLQKRLRVQRIAFYVVAAILGVGLVVAHMVYFMITFPAKEKLEHLLSYIACLST